MSFEIFKPDKKNINPDTLNIDDDFFSHSHGICQSFNGGEFTLCGVACCEWEYTKTFPRKRITCPDCLGLIRKCKTYKL